jgi:50S ribosomal protein L16 3-hydroxylase
MWPRAHQLVAFLHRSTLLLGTRVTCYLDALFQPRSRAEFTVAYAANHPFVVHGLTDSITALTALPLLASLDALLNAWPFPVAAHLPNVADEASSIEASVVDARKLFDNGMGLLFNEAHLIAPELQRWLHGLRQELQLSALTQSRCLVYATPKGKGTAGHFDQNINFVLQLHGRKQWQLAANSHVESPLTRHTMGQLVDAELQTYAALPMPNKMPDDCQTIVLEPGSLLFVPRGMWHATHGFSDALSLNFTYSSPSWLDIFTTALRGRLAMSSVWRETATPMNAEMFQQLLLELAHDAPHWDADEILAVTESADAVSP